MSFIDWCWASWNILDVISWLHFFYFEKVQNIALILHIDHRGKVVRLKHKFQCFFSFILKNLIKAKALRTFRLPIPKYSSAWECRRVWSILSRTLSREMNIRNFSVRIFMRYDTFDMTSYHILHSHKNLMEATDLTHRKNLQNFDLTCCIQVRRKL